MFKEILRVNRPINEIKTGDKRLPISWGENFSPNKEYKIVSFCFNNENIESDGCIFEIQPRGSTAVMEIIDENFECQRIAIKGSGWCLRTDLNNPDYETEIYKLNANNEVNPLIELRQGWVDCFIAGDEGMEVADISTPKFNPKVEKNIPIDSPKLPKPFWIAYKKLKQIS